VVGRSNRLTPTNLKPLISVRGLLAQGRSSRAIVPSPAIHQKGRSSKTTSLQRLDGTAARLYADVSVPSEHSIVDVPCKLPNRLHSHTWIFCQPRYECVARVVDPARDPLLLSAVRRMVEIAP
jgi:hypothetical protein